MIASTGRWKSRTLLLGAMALAPMTCVRGDAVHCLFGNEDFGSHSHDISAVIFSPDSKMVACALTYPKIWIWEAKTGTLKRKIDLPGWVNAAAFSPNGKTFAVATIRPGVILCQIYLYNVADWKVQRVFDVPRAYAYNLDFSPDSKLLVAGCGDYKIWQWNILSGRLLRKIPLGTVAFAADGVPIASGSSSVYRPTGRTPRKMFWGKVRNLPSSAWFFTSFAGRDRRSVFISRNANTIATFEEGSYLSGHPQTKYTLKLWNARTGRFRKSFVIEPVDVAYISESVLSPDGKTLALGVVIKSDYHDAIQLLNVGTGKSYRTFNVPPRQFAFSPNSEALATVMPQQWQGVDVWKLAG